MSTKVPYISANLAADLHAVWSDGHHDAIAYGVNKNDLHKWHTGELAEFYNKGFAQGMADSEALA